MALTCDDTIPVTIDGSKKDDVVPRLYPVVLGSPETTLSVDDGSSESEVEEWSKELALQNHLAAPQASSINVESSTDVVIGPLTQFHGPVTIYQNINSNNSSSPPLGVECKSDITLNSSAKLAIANHNEPGTKPKLLKFLPGSSQRFTIFAAIVVAMLTAVTVSLLLSLNITANKNEKHGQSFNSNGNFDPDENTTSTAGNHTIYHKKAWGGQGSEDFIPPLIHPTKYAVVAHTVGHVCKSFEDCAKSVAAIQSMHISDRKYNDIAYNFVIGGDGNIYEGRGWDLINEQKNNTLSICFTGDFTKKYLSPEMISALKELLKLGVQLNKLDADYKLLCHRQVANTASPGKNAIEEIAKFPEYDGTITL